MLEPVVSDTKAGTFTRLHTAKKPKARLIVSSMKTKD